MQFSQRSYRHSAKNRWHQYFHTDQFFNFGESWVNRVPLGIAATSGPRLEFCRSRRFVKAVQCQHSDSRHRRSARRIDRHRPFIGSVTNQGVIRPGVGTGALTIQGNLTQTLDGMLDIQLGGTTQHDQLVVTGTARLHGGINVSRINGYVPSVSDTFRVLAASAVSGALPRQNGVNILGEFRRLNVAINSTSVDLMAEAVQEEVPRLNITTLQPATVAWPAEFDGWHLMTSTNLSDPSNWVESLSSSNFTTVTAPDKERYWKLVRP